MEFFPQKGCNQRCSGIVAIQVHSVYLGSMARMLQVNGKSEC